MQVRKTESREIHDDRSRVAVKVSKGGHGSRSRFQINRDCKLLKIELIFAKSGCTDGWVARSFGRFVVWPFWVLCVCLCECTCNEPATTTAHNCITHTRTTAHTRTHQRHW
ncbi:uncharacterized protein LOC108150350 [Drosophila elegans]|uniref:uncharacterized protein LOC108150350 n=1 Tax=Drosophila elegans TaxID=30023 RepID=UPI0007E6099D|nr:uncharacterized protein LOC108150350 [Drosophila elegans]